MGFNATESELKVLAGTDETGTSMYSLAQAAQAKGLSAAGMKLSTDELRPNNIVHVILDGTPHYSVIKEVTNESVRLADPSLGNIEMSREKFNEIYTGNALVITNPNMEALGVSVNETAEQVNNTDAVSVENLTAEEMESIKGQQLSVSAPVTSSMLSAETMQSIRGKAIWKAYALVAAVGAVFEVHRYISTNRRWTWQGVGWAVLRGAVQGVAMTKAAKYGFRKWGKKPPRRPPRWRSLNT